MKNNPYIGPRPFERADRHRFYGRAREARDLLALIMAERVVLFYAQSGAGKTSLLNTQIIPGLEDEGFTVLPLVRVGSDRPPDVPAHAVENIFVFSACLGLLGAAAVPEQLTNTRLGATIETCLGRVPLAEDDQPRPPILIFDQFEEILTTHRDRWQEAAGFFDQVTEALAARPNLGVVFAMREDYVAGLDPYTVRLPRRLKTRFRMEQLGVAGALEALKKPAQAAGVTFRPGVAERLVDDLRRIQVARFDQPARADTALALGPYVEPVQMQVVCSRLWDNLPDRPGQAIGWTEIRKFGNIDRALADFYQSALTQVAGQVPIGERVVRQWFGEQLITPLRTRGLALRGEQSTNGLPNAAVDILEAQHVIRADVRAGARWYELAHDRLIDPALESNRAWEAARQTPLRLAAKRWQESGHEAGLLYRGQALTAARAVAQAQPLDMEPVEQEFLAASAQAEQALARLRTWRLVGATLAVFIIVLVSYLAVAAERARESADQQRQIALARQLAAQTLTHLDDQLDLALLLSLEANRLLDTPEVKGSLLAGVAAHPQLVAYLSGHASGVEALALQPDGQVLASGDDTGVIRLWNVAERRLQSAPLIGHTARINTLAFRPTGRQFVSGGEDGVVNLWTLDQGAATSLTLQTYPYPVESVAFTPDGAALAIGTHDGSITFWDANFQSAKGEPLQAHAQSVISLAFSPDGRRLASGSCAKLEGMACAQGEVRLWEAVTHHPIGPPITDHTDWASSVAFSPDGRWLAIGSWDKTISIWDAATLKPVGEPLVGPIDYINQIAFSPDGQWLAAASWDKTIRVWQTTTWQPLGQPLTGHTDAVFSLVFAPDNRTLLSGGADRKALIWDVTSRQAPATTLAQIDGTIVAVAVSPDGQIIAAGGSEKTITLWNAETGQSLGAPLSGHTATINSLAFSPDGQTLASGSSDNTLRLWNVANQQLRGVPLTGHQDRVRSVAFSPDGQTLASGSLDHMVRLWNVATGQPIGAPLIGPADGVLSVAFSPDGQTLAAGSCGELREDVCRHGEVWLWDLRATPPISQVLRGHTDRVRAVAFSPDGQTLASSGDDNAIILWNVATRQPIGEPLIEHGNWVRTVAFSPDGQRLVSGSDDLTLMLWDVATRQRIGPPLIGHTDWVNSVAFRSGRGALQQVVSGSQDGTLVLWEVDFRAWQQRACRRANRNLTLAEWANFVDTDPGTYRRTCPDLVTTEATPN